MSKIILKYKDFEKNTFFTIVRDDIITILINLNTYNYGINIERK